MIVFTNNVTNIQIKTNKNNIIKNVTDPANFSKLTKKDQDTTNLMKTIISKNFQLATQINFTDYLSVDLPFI